MLISLESSSLKSINIKSNMNLSLPGTNAMDEYEILHILCSFYRPVFSPRKDNLSTGFKNSETERLIEDRYKYLVYVWPNNFRYQSCFKIFIDTHCQRSELKLLVFFLCSPLGGEEIIIFFVRKLEMTYKF